jgi:CMP-N-acetylneuraminic acid synthetase
MVGLIPCRKGSKRVPGKALIDLCGKPLLWYTLNAAEESELETYYLTSDYDRDDLEDAGLNLSEFKKLIVIRRPNDLCEDGSPYTEYIEHFLRVTGSKEFTMREFETVCLLQPTCPLRTAQHINEAIDIYRHGGLPGLVSAFEMPKGLLYNSNFSSIFGTGFIRDDLAYVRNSSIYIFAVNYFINQKSIFVNPSHIYTMNMWESVDINTQNDLNICEKLLKQERG